MDASADNGSQTAVPTVHAGKTCNQCNDGTSIVGKRYKKKGFINVDLCETCFESLHQEEKANYEEEEVPSDTKNEIWLSVLLLLLLALLGMLISGATDTDTVPDDSTNIEDEDVEKMDFSGENGSALGRFYIAPPTITGLFFLGSLFFVNRPSNSRFAGSEAFKPGWNGWSNSRRGVRKTLTILLSGCLIPVMFLKEAFHEEQRFSAGYTDSRFVSHPNPAKSLSWRDLDDDDGTYYPLRKKATDNLGFHDFSRQFSCRPNSTFYGTTALALSKGAPSSTGIAYSDCECECTTNPGCGRFVFKPNDNVADELYTFARTGICELWPPPSSADGDVVADGSRDGYEGMATLIIGLGSGLRFWVREKEFHFACTPNNPTAAAADRDSAGSEAAPSSSSEDEAGEPTCFTTYGKVNPRLAFASTVCSAVATNYHCYREGYRGPMFNCSIPKHVSALQIDERIVTIDCFRALPFSLIAYLDIFGIGFGMVCLGLYLFDRSEKWASIGVLDEDASYTEIEDDGGDEQPGLEEGTQEQSSKKSNCCACTAKSKRIIWRRVTIFVGILGHGIFFTLTFFSGWNARQIALEGAAYVALCFYATFLANSLKGYDAGINRQTILEILFRKHGSTSGNRTGWWTMESTESLLETVQPSTSFEDRWIAQELPNMNGAELWFSFNSRWQRKLKKESTCTRICNLLTEAVWKPLCGPPPAPPGIDDEEDQKRANDRTEIMNWEILFFASAVKHAMEKSGNTALTFNDVWFATWDIIGNEKEADGKAAWWMLGRSYWHNDQFTDQGKIGRTKVAAMTAFSSGISPTSSNEASAASLQDATPIEVNAGFGFEN
eukprot:gene20990-35441_t